MVSVGIMYLAPFSLPHSGNQSPHEAGVNVGSSVSESYRIISFHGTIRKTEYPVCEGVFIKLK